MNCSTCGTPLSQENGTCPNCHTASPPVTKASPWRNISMVLAIALVLSIGGMGYAIVQGEDSPAPSDETEAREDTESVEELDIITMGISDYSGTVSLTNAQGEETLSSPLALASQDLLQTQEDSRVFFFLDSKELSLDSNSALQLFRTEDKIDLELKSGHVSFALHGPMIENESLSFHTQNAMVSLEESGGIFSYDQENNISLLSILSGSATITTIADIQSISAGEVAVVRMVNGTPSIQVVDPQLTLLPLYHSDSFLNQVETVHHLSTDSLRESNKPTGVTLGADISLLGNCRTLSFAQAESFAQVLERESPDLVTFFDGGNGIPVMIIGELISHEHYMGSETTVTFLHPSGYQWNGVTTQLIAGSLSPRNIYQKGDTYTLSTGTDTRGMGGVDAIVHYSFSFDQGVRQLPADSFTYMHYYEGGEFYDMNWDMVAGATTESACLAFLQNQTFEYGMANFYFLNGSYGLNNYSSSENTSNQIPESPAMDLWDTTSSYWNKTSHVLTALKQ